MAKVAIVHSVTSYGGSAVSLVDIIKMVTPRHEVTVYMPQRASEKAKEAVLAVPGVRLSLFTHEPQLFSHFSGVNTAINPGFYRRLLMFYNNGRWKRELGGGRYDLVLLNSSVLSILGRSLRKAGVKTICFDRETHNMTCGGVFDSAMRRLLNKQSGVCFLTEAEMKHYGLSTETCVIRDVLDTERFTITGLKESIRQQLGIPKNARVVLFAGGISELKGTKPLLEAFGIAARRHEEARLLILGPELVADPAYAAECKKLIEAEPRAEYYGNRDDIAMFYKAADMLAFPSTKPHQARPVYEAGFFGLPVIISDFEETAELAVNGINALCFEPGSVDSLAEKLEALLEDGELVSQLGAENRRMYEKLHSMNAVSEELEGFMEKILNEAGERGNIGKGKDR